MKTNHLLHINVLLPIIAYINKHTTILDESSSINTMLGPDLCFAHYDETRSRPGIWNLQSPQTKSLPLRRESLPRTESRNHSAALPQ